MENERAQDILLSSIFGIIFGLACGLWASIYDHLWLENASKEFLFKLWVLYSVVIMGMIYMLWTFAKRLGARTRAPAQAGNKFRLTVKSIINLILIVCTALTLYIYVEYNVHWSAYAIAAFASFLGVFFAFNFDLIIYNLRQRERRYRLLRDIHKELKRNSSKLVGKGYVLSKYGWDSGISTGLIQNLDSNELEKLSDIYHNIDINNFEAKMCRQAGESFSSLPAESSERAAAKRRWERLSSILKTREYKLKKTIDDIFNEDFWERSGVKKDEL